MSLIGIDKLLFSASCKPFQICIIFWKSNAKKFKMILYCLNKKCLTPLNITVSICMVCVCLWCNGDTNNCIQREKRTLLVTIIICLLKLSLCSSFSFHRCCRTLQVCKEETWRRVFFPFYPYKTMAYSNYSSLNRAQLTFEYLHTNS